MEKRVQTRAILDRNRQYYPNIGESAYFVLSLYLILDPHLAHASRASKPKLDDDAWKTCEEELQIALALSLSISEPSIVKPESSRPQLPEEEEDSASELEMRPVSVTKVRALWDFSASNEGELSFNEGDIITVLGALYKDWWRGSLGGQTGLFPITYVETLEEKEISEDPDETKHQVPQKEGKEIEKLNAELEDECRVCFDGKPDHCLIPCGHTGLCSTCATKMSRCPFCKVNVERVQKLWKI
jgi:Variant SH3 domain/Zinc finger, C3HC4 type (RING finger)